MAEAWTRRLKPDKIVAFSAGVAPKGIDPRAVKAMAEAGIDISDQTSKDIDSLGRQDFDYVVTLCDNAREACPYFPAKTALVHRGFEDPPVLAADAKDEEEAMAHYRRVRDAIKGFVAGLPDSLNNG